MSVIIEWAIALAFIGVVAYIYRAYARTRSRANDAIMSSLDTLEKKWAVLVDAGEDVPVEILERCYFMLKVVRNPNTSRALFLALHPRSAKNFDLNGEVAMLPRSMREPLQDVLEDFLGAWFVIVANHNLFLRSLIRVALGRIAEQSGAVNPKAKGAVRAANRVKDRQHKHGACAHS